MYFYTSIILNSSGVYVKSEQALKRSYFADFVGFTGKKAYNIRRRGIQGDNGFYGERK